MDLSDEQFDYNKLKKQGTGGPDEHSEYKVISYPFDKYEIKIKLSPNNEFIEVIEVKINKGFLSNKQKIASHGFHDVDEFYRE